LFLAYNNLRNERGMWKGSFINWVDMADMVGDIGEFVFRWKNRDEGAKYHYGMTPFISFMTLYNSYSLCC